MELYSHGYAIHTQDSIISQSFHPFPLSDLRKVSPASYNYAQNASIEALHMTIHP